MRGTLLLHLLVAACHLHIGLQDKFARELVRSDGNLAGFFNVDFVVWRQGSSGWVPSQGHEQQSGMGYPSTSILFRGGATVATIWGKIWWALSVLFLPHEL